MGKSDYKSAFERLIGQLTKLPGIGNRSAERIAFYLLREPVEEAFELADAIRAFKTDLKVCSECGNVSEVDPCPICGDEARDGHVVLVVEQPSDIAMLEHTGSFEGKYHVLMGRLAPLDGIGPGDLNVQPLVDRIKRSHKTGGDGVIKEVILGMNPTLEGDGTALYLGEVLEQMGVKVTRLARGMPAGSTLAGLSKTVLSDAIQARQDFES
ncbi:recombination protein RecR [Planctomycetota bacterium]|nr:recombination protein RecR [Planctomycetota bacterium]